MWFTGRGSPAGASDSNIVEAEVAEPDDGFEEENNQPPETSFLIKIKDLIFIRVSLPPAVWKLLVSGVPAPLATYWFLFLFHR